MTRPRKVPDPEPVWHALADPTRRRILAMLRDGPRSTGEIADGLPIGRHSVMGHLTVLGDAALLTSERRGRRRVHHADATPLEAAYRRLVTTATTRAAATALDLGVTAERHHHTWGAPVSPSLAIDVRAAHLVSAPAATTWSTLLDLPSWWPPRWSEGRRLVFEPVLGGRLGVLADTGPPSWDDGELWGTVRVLRREAELTVDGAMGLPGPLLGRWTISLEPEGSGTRVVVVHQALGLADADDPDCYERGWGETLERLASAVTKAQPLQG